MTEWIQLAAALALAALLAGATGCATMGGGLTYPISINGQKILVNSAPVLTMEAGQCNALAQTEYNFSVIACTGGFSQFVQIQTAQANGALDLLCRGFGYTDAANQLLVPPTVALMNCPMPTPAASPAAKM